MVNNRQASFSALIKQATTDKIFTSTSQNVSIHAFTGEINNGASRSSFPAADCLSDGSRRFHAAFAARQLAADQKSHNRRGQTTGQPSAL